MSEQESISGPGSSLLYTEDFRRGLELFLGLAKCESIFDGPCGDFNWMRAVRLPGGTRYVGGDIAPELIEYNSEIYEDENRSFFQIDLLKEKMPDADIWLCRDFLFSLSYNSIVSVLRNGLRSSYRYFMFTSHINPLNSHRDAPDGTFRELNMRAAPYCFPEPIAQIDDWIEGFPIRYVGIWGRDQIVGTLTNLLSREPVAKS